MPAYYVCKCCSQEHPCPLFFSNEKDFNLASYGVNAFPCPVTHKWADYDKHRLFWTNSRSETGPAKLRR